MTKLEGSLVLICSILFIFAVLLLVDCFQTTHISDWGIIIDKRYEPQKTTTHCEWDATEKRTVCHTTTTPAKYILVIKTELSGSEDLHQRQVEIFPMNAIEVYLIKKQVFYQ